MKSVSVGFDEHRSEKLWVEIDSLLRETDLAIEGVDLFAVCIGPGGFTGLRVGIAAAKGFAVAAGKPIIGVTSLEATAANVTKTCQVLAMLNAYKGEVYSQLFSRQGDGAVVAENEPVVSTLRFALERIQHVEQLVVAGEAAVELGHDVAAFADEIRPDGSPPSPRSWLIQDTDSSTAEGVARLALMRYGEGVRAEDVAACYVKRPEAEIKLAKGLLGSKIDRVRRLG